MAARVPPSTAARTHPSRATGPSDAADHDLTESNGRAARIDGRTAVGSDGVGSKRSKGSSTSASAPTLPREFVVPLLCGVVFGTAFQLSRVHECFFIREQLLLHRFLMVKMFLSAAATSMLVMTFLPLVSRTAAERIAHRRTTTLTRSVAEQRGIPALAIGGGLLGAGMALSGSCPGTVFAQVGAGSHMARFVLLGGLLAAATYPLLDLIPSFPQALKRGRAKLQTQTLPDLLGVAQANAWCVSLVTVVSFAGLVYTLENLFPWRTDLDALVPSQGTSTAWSTLPTALPPWLAGVMVGSLQIPLLLLTDHQLGSSSSYVTVVANLLHAVSPKAGDKVPSYKSKRNEWWQVWLMCGVLLGAFAFASANDAPVMSDHLVSPSQAVLGGFLLVAGARIASGCTSGHGISGMGYLAMNSFIAVAAMFVMGIATALLLFK